MNRRVPTPAIARHRPLRMATGVAMLCLCMLAPARAADTAPLDAVPGRKSDTLELARAAARAAERRARLMKQLAASGVDGTEPAVNASHASEAPTVADAKGDPTADRRQRGMPSAGTTTPVANGKDATWAAAKPPAIEGSTSGTMRIRPSADPRKAIDAIRERLQPRGVEPHVDAEGNALLKVGSAEAESKVKANAKAKAAGASHLALAPVSLTAAPARRTVPGIAHGESGRGANGSPHGAQSKSGEKAHAPHWSYDGEASPDRWARLSPEWATCAKGTRQSPIDIHDGIKVDLESVRFEYRPSAFTVVDNGHTIQVNLPPGNAITVAGKRYELLQFHFHKPAEERVDGKPFDMVVHLVHKDANGKLAVVAVLLEKGSAQDVVQNVWNHLPLEKGDEVEAGVPLDPTALLPVERGYYTYMGSLTTPPCSEGVLWMVMKQPVGISDEQLAIFARLYPMNARPLQAASARLIKESN